MPIPNVKRVIFAKHALVEVVSQFTFPRLLEIDTELPVGFQKMIQKDYPALSAGKMVEFQLDLEKAETRRADARRYEFSSQDGKWQAVLTSEFIALTTADYKKWEDFKAKMLQLVDTIIDCYRPSVFTRIGLRYRDSIAREPLGLTDVPWRDLLAPHISGVLGREGMDEREVLGLRSSFALSLPNNVKVQVNHGIALGRSGTPEYMIDSDFFVDQPTEATLDAATRTLEAFRPHTNNLFNWFICERLFNAMEPTAVDSRK
jgi:uncharacterized protein (TIGR04255 family)